MTPIVLRGLQSPVHDALQRAAAEHGRTVQEEIVQILTNATQAQYSRPPNLGRALYEAAQALGRFEDFKVPSRNDTIRIPSFE